MKKLMIAAAIVCAAAMSHAAAVTWEMATISGPKSDGKYDGVTFTTANKVTGYLYNITEAQYGTWLTALTTTDWEKQQAAMLEIYDAVKGGTELTSIGNTNKGKITLTDTRDISTATKDTPIDLYSAIIMTYTDGDGKDWIVANVGTKHVEANQPASLASLNTFVGGAGTTTTAIQGWASEAVPEPTSGLLLLLGVAGLALRRRA